MHQLDQTVIAQIQQPFWDTWQAIAPDCMEFVEDNEGCVEMVIDADRMSTFAGEEGEAAQRIIRELIRQYGYDQTLKFLSRNFPMF